jgi:hypothetical protein
VFVDGITTYNNPSFQAFLMATLEPYKMNWLTGENKLLVVSIGTGSSPKANENLDPSEMNLIYNAGSIPSALMFAALNEQDLLCRVFGKCLAGDPLDRSRRPDENHRPVGEALYVSPVQCWAPPRRPQGAGLSASAKECAEA